MDQDLKALAFAYKLAGEFDYCPGQNDIDDDKTEMLFGLNVDQIPEKTFEYEGNRQDEIASMIVDKIMRG